MPTDLPGQRAVDDEIRAHESAIRSLRSRRNSLSVACRLPDEITSLILVDTLPDHFSVTAQCLSVAGFCRHWRNVALDTPKFWSFLPRLNANLVEVMAQRAREYPLHVIWRIDGQTIQSHEETATVMNTVNEQIQQLDIPFSPYINWTLVKRRLSDFRLPRLEKLRMYAWDQDHRALRELPLATLSSLTSLELHNLMICSAPSPLSLRHLSVSITYLSPSELLDFLRSTPRLEILTARSLMVTNPPLSAALVSLPLLNSLSLTCTDIPSTDVFKFLQFPPSCSFSLLWEVQSSLNLSDLSTLDLPVSQLSPAPSAHKAVLSINKTRWKQTSFCLYKDNDPSPMFRLDLPFKSPLPSFDTKYARMISPLQLGHVHELNVHIETPEYGISAKRYQPILALFTNVKRITLDRCNLNILPVFVNNKDDGELGRLHQLTVLHVNFGATPSLSEANTNKNYLIDFVRQGFDGAPFVEKLVVRECIILAASVDELRTHTEVSWDGLEISKKIPT